MVSTFFGFDFQDEEVETNRVPSQRLHESRKVRSHFFKGAHAYEAQQKLNI